MILMITSAGHCRRQCTSRDRRSISLGTSGLEYGRESTLMKLASFSLDLCQRKHQCGLRGNGNFQKYIRSYNEPNAYRRSSTSSAPQYWF